ncbi:MAG: hypothetical protein IKI72_05940 [Bacteroidales bacterium]|nr:hypothetical protein [Bacteroidales bacterium]
MNRKTLIAACAAVFFGLLQPTMVEAGGLVTNTNQNIRFVRMLARDASTDIDAIFANPAGTAFMDDGFYLSLNVQTIKQERIITSTFPMFENGQKEFKGKTFVPVYPQIDVAYKKGDWTFSGALSVIGGGGQCEFENGLPMFEASIATIPALLTKMGIPTSKYSVDIYLNGEQYIYSAQLGAARALSESVSIYAGMRLNWVRNHYDGYIRDIKINPMMAGNPLAGMMAAPDFFGMLSASLAQADPATSAMAAGYAKATSNMDLDMDQKGFGITPIFGIDVKTGKWNFGLKYEMNTDIETKNETKVNTLPAGKKEAYDDGVKTAADIPGMVTLGASYEIIDGLRAAVGYHHYFDNHANLASNREHLIDHGINEYMWGVEWDCTDRITVSGGMQFTKSGVTDAYQSDLNFSLSSYSFGFGGAYKLTPKTTINAGYFCTKYDHWDVAYANFNGTGIPGSTDYYRTSNTFGLGVDFKF